VLGAYLVLYPGARIVSLVPLGFFVQLVELPAILVLLLWFALQLYQGLASLAGGRFSPVAFAAHVGGFVAGLLLVRLFARPRRARRVSY
jgi:membrane associated rhomboid family serine protease